MPHLPLLTTSYNLTLAHTLTIPSLPFGSTPYQLYCPRPSPISQKPKKERRPLHPRPLRVLQTRLHSNIPLRTWRMAEFTLYTFVSSRPTHITQHLLSPSSPILTRFGPNSHQRTATFYMDIYETLRTHTKLHRTAPRTFCV